MRLLPHLEGFDGHVVNISEEFSMKYVQNDQLYLFYDGTCYMYALI